MVNENWRIWCICFVVGCCCVWWSADVSIVLFFFFLGWTFELSFAPFLNENFLANYALHQFYYGWEKKNTNDIRLCMLFCSILYKRFKFCESTVCDTNWCHQNHAYAQIHTLNACNAYEYVGCSLRQTHDFGLKREMSQVIGTGLECFEIFAWKSEKAVE